MTNVLEIINEASTAELLVLPHTWEVGGSLEPLSSKINMGNRVKLSLK
jgi:hypothetical protein